MKKLNHIVTRNGAFFGLATAPLTEGHCTFSATGFYQTWKFDADGQLHLVEQHGTLPVAYVQCFLIFRNGELWDATQRAQELLQAIADNDTVWLVTTRGDALKCLEPV
jgi:hypothetical protein